MREKHARTHTHKTQRRYRVVSVLSAFFLFVRFPPVTARRTLAPRHQADIPPLAPIDHIACRAVAQRRERAPFWRMGRLRC